MKIKDIMMTKVISVSPKMSVSQVADIIFSNNFHGVPVVEGKKVVGIITEDDFFLKNYDEVYLPSYVRFIKENGVVGNLPKDIKSKIKRLIGAKASDLMSKEVTTVTLDMDATELMEIIKKTKFTTFPVTDKENNLVGIVTLSDILGTVRKASGDMGRAMKKSGEIKDIELIAKDVQSFWKDRFVLMSRKKLSFWEGEILVLLTVALFAFFYIFISLNSKDACELDNETNSALSCVRFTYTNWSPCGPDGLQTRQVIEKLPQGCQGGAFPELSQRCQ